MLRMVVPMSDGERESWFHIINKRCSSSRGVVIKAVNFNISFRSLTLRERYPCSGEVSVAVIYCHIDRMFSNAVLFSWNRHPQYEDVEAQVGKRTDNLPKKKNPPRHSIAQTSPYRSVYESTRG